MIFADLPVSPDLEILGMDDFPWYQALVNHEELEVLRGVEPTDDHQRFLWRILCLGVIGLEAMDKPMDTSTRSMRHTSAVGIRLWKMWREAELQVSSLTPIIFWLGSEIMS